MSEMYLTISQAARVLDVSANTLRDWHKCGKLMPSMATPLGWRLYRQSEIEEFKNKRENKENTPQTITEVYRQTT